MTGSFDAETGNAFIQNRQVLYLAAGNTLLIYQYQALIGKNKYIAEQFEAYLNFLELSKQLRIVFQ